MSWVVITKTTIVVIFNLKNSHLLTLSWLTKEVFQVNGRNRPVANLSVSIFILSREKYQHQSHSIRNFRFFLRYFGFLPLLEKFEPHCLSAIRIFSCFSRHNSRKFRQIIMRIVKALPFIHQPDWVVPKASDVSATDWLYQYKWKNTKFFG